MEPQLPTARALAIAGHLIAGGVGVHQRAPPSPEGVETDGRGEPTGVLRESSAWHFRDTVSLPSPDELVDAMRAGQKLATSRGVTAIHDKDGWLGALDLFQRLRSSGSLQFRVWQSQPHDRIGALRELGLRS